MTRDVLELRPAFGIEFLDPVSNDLISRDLQVNLPDNEAQPILSASGRFVWRAASAPLPQAVRVRSLNGNYDDRSYALQLAAPPAPPSLVRLSLLTTVSYPFTPEVTLVRGHLIEGTATPAVGVAAAEIQLLWFDRDGNTWLEKHGPRCVSSAGGYFAVALPLPRGARPKREANQSLSLMLSIERRDLPGAPQRRTTPPLNDIFESDQHVLPADIVWSQL